ncbi:MAG: hypothetical protein KIT36_14285 [Alphaproteobacteria bacterium]|nr:hypothetical protein [Alphaproteobacteria bacterium]
MKFPFVVTFILCVAIGFPASAMTQAQADCTWNNMAPAVRDELLLIARGKADIGEIVVDGQLDAAEACGIHSDSAGRQDRVLEYMLHRALIEVDLAAAESVGVSQVDLDAVWNELTRDERTTLVRHIMAPSSLVRPFDGTPLTRAAQRLGIQCVKDGRNFVVGYHRSKIRMLALIDPDDD